MSEKYLEDAQSVVAETATFLSGLREKGFSDRSIAQGAFVVASDWLEAVANEDERESLSYLVEDLLSKLRPDSP